MGSRFLRRLNAEGWNVRGWNRSRAATLPLKKYGFAIDDTLADLVSGSDVLLSSWQTMMLCGRLIWKKMAFLQTYSLGQPSLR